MSGLAQQPNHHFHYTIGVKSTQEKTWDLLTDVSRWSDWDTELKSATLFSNFGLGAKGELIPKKGPKLPFEITAYSAGKFYIFTTKMPIGSLEIRRSLVSKAGITYFTDDIQFTGFLRRLFGMILGRSFKLVLPEVMENFRKMVEKRDA
ncbi:MAG: SRPBCC family protein [Saprospiraceae bacterium]